MTSNHDPAKVTMFHITLEHTLDHFLEFWIFRGETLFGPVEPTPYSSTNPAVQFILSPNKEAKLRFHEVPVELARCTKNHLTYIMSHGSCACFTKTGNGPPAAEFPVILEQANDTYDVC